VRRPRLSDGIDDDAVAEFVADCNCKAVAFGHAGRCVSKSTVADTRIERQLVVIGYTSLYNVTRNEALDVGTPLAQVLSAIAHRVLLKLAVDLFLRQ
jgi:hypothetical protein